MENKIKFPGILLEQAKEILNTAYEYDRASAYNNDFTLVGKKLIGRITKNEDKSNDSSINWFDVTITSSTLSEVTLREAFAQHLYSFNL